MLASEALLRTVLYDEKEREASFGYSILRLYVKRPRLEHHQLRPHLLPPLVPSDMVDPHGCMGGRRVDRMNRKSQEAGSIGENEKKNSHGLGQSNGGHATGSAKEAEAGCRAGFDRWDGITRKDPRTRGLAAASHRVRGWHRRGGFLCRPVSERHGHPRPEFWVYDIWKGRLASP
ncbi:hypothetical protein BJV74DRAFT_799511 [Russula compacta]|nr:hypothetical protein BJV74DRAFT_799511 [Russula compacta]